MPEMRNAQTDRQPANAATFTCACCGKEADVTDCACYSATGGCICKTCLAAIRAGVCTVSGALGGRAVPGAYLAMPRCDVGYALRTGRAAGICG